MSSTNENDELLNSSNNEGSNNEGSDLGTESENNDSENNNEEDVTDKGGGSNTVANSGGTPTKEGRPKPNAGVGVYGLR